MIFTIILLIIFGVLQSVGLLYYRSELKVEREKNKQYRLVKSRNKIKLEVKK